MSEAVNYDINVEECKISGNLQEDISLTEVPKLLKKYIIYKINLQRILFIFSFLTFGAADGISAAYMIGTRGIISEANPFIRFIYESNGINGVITIKLWLVMIMLFFVWNISRENNNYWMINGFLFSLFMFGIIAAGANLLTAGGIESPAAGSIIVAYLLLVILLTTLGDAIDKIHQWSEVKELNENRNSGKVEY